MNPPLLGGNGRNVATTIVNQTEAAR